MASTLTDKSRVKSILGITSTNQDTEIDIFVDSVSRKVEKYLNNYQLETGRTEYYDVENSQRSIILNAAPVDSIVAIHDSSDWTWSSNDLIATGDYRLDSDKGIVYFKTALVGGPQTVQIEYTGGLGTSYTDILSNGFEDLVAAVDQQVAYEFMNRDNNGAAQYSDDAGSVTSRSTAWLPEVKNVLDQYRRY